MSFPYSPKLEDVKIENLQTQLDYLNLLRLRHLLWMNAASDPRTKGMHHNIVEQIEGITDQYSDLLVALHK